MCLSTRTAVCFSTAVCGASFKHFQVGTVIKGADVELGTEDPVFAIASILPLSLWKENQQLKDILLNMLVNND